MSKKSPLTKSRTRLIYWLLFAPFILVPASVWILDGYGEISPVVLWLGLGLEIASVVGYFIGLYLLSVQSPYAPTFRSKKFSWPAMLLFLIPLVLLAVSLLLFIPGEKPPLVVTELLLLRVIALASVAIGAIITFKRIKPRKTAWMMVGLAVIPYLLIVVVSYATGTPHGFDNIEQIHQTETWNLIISLSSIIIGLVFLAIGWFKFRKEK
jgi:hypothetical protein